MSFLKIIYWGWYQILDKTIYLYGKSNGGFGIKEHAFFISFSLHGINIWTIFSFVYIEYYGNTFDLYFPLFIFMNVFLLGYLKFLKNKKADAVISADINLLKGILFILFTLVYSFVTVYLMIEVGNYIRKEMGFDIEI
jgi:phosphoglycerol transferase MdoB-like AlkP superfamily enzyme